MEDDDLDIDDLLLAVMAKTPERNPYLHYLNAKVVCLNCNQEFWGSTTRQKKWFDEKDIVYTTFFCPCCPATSDIATWLSKTACIKGGKTG
jgi:hypothetical protein